MIGIDVRIDELHQEQEQEQGAWSLSPPGPKFGHFRNFTVCANIVRTKIGDQTAFISQISTPHHS